MAGDSHTRSVRTCRDPLGRADERMGRAIGSRSMNPRSPVQRLALITVATATAFAGLLIALKSVDPNSGAHGLLFVMFMVAGTRSAGLRMVAGKRANR